jgi:hypothetical protein
MQGPTITTPNEDDASIPTEYVRNGPNLNRTFTVRRKAAKRILPWDLPIDEIQLALPLPHDEYMRETNRPRLEEPVPTSATDVATPKMTSHDTTVVLPPDAAADHADSDHVMDMHPNARASGAPRRWTPEEDVELTSAVANTPKKKWGKKGEKKTDWDAVAALIPGRTKRQCNDRWRNFLMYIIDQTNGHSGAWTEDEDIKLKDAAQKHGGNNWDAIAALVPGRMRNQCYRRWHNAFNPSIDQTSERPGKRTEEEINMLKHSVRMNGHMDWAAIAAPLTGHTAESWCNNWLEISKASVARVNGRAGTWTEDENSKLKDAVQRYGDNDWDAIAALVPGRTKRQCHDRWHEYLNPSIDQMTGHTGKWAEDEDIKLKDAVQKHGDNNWDEIATMVPGRTKKQCHSRWHNNVLDPNIDQTNLRSGAWTGDEDGKLQEAVQLHGGKDWVAIAALVPGRTRIQCTTRWHAFLKHSIDGATGRTGTWTEDEDTRLKYAVHTHGGKNWDDIAMLVPGRTRKQCHSRWYNLLSRHRPDE